jgi:tRNA1Val (adenine37-N6)-methyltransferase
MSNNHFEFKQFRIKQEKSAMKVGTDGVLLGAWTDVENAKYILDVGTGTGLLALMMAQRCSAKIDAIEIEESAFKEAKSNIKKSPWSDRISVFHSDYNDFTETNIRKYDTVVCNPPFFENSLNAPDKSRSNARHNITLTFTQLINNSKLVINPNGKLVIILPQNNYESFCMNAKSAGFYLCKKTFVQTTVGKSPKRVLMQFNLTPCVVSEEIISIRDENGEYTKEYRELTYNYYKFFTC